ncbi:hypothetical protein [Microcoleus sp. MON2_D5]|uniref:hypothetical protein n=1 Tax=Microcoleus sp. MON2_D5 TaxID=2818833 RepID=UPI002FD4BE24
MKASLLADYIIICVALSAILLLLLCIALTWTTKTIPAEIYTLISGLAMGAFSAAALKKELKPDTLIKGSFVNYALMGLATTKVFLVFNYGSLIWAERVIPKELAPLISGLAVIVLTVTTFRNSGFEKPNRNLESEPIDHVNQNK